MFSSSNSEALVVHANAPRSAADSEDSRMMKLYLVSKEANYKTGWIGRTLLLTVAVRSGVGIGRSREIDQSGRCRSRRDAVGNVGSVLSIP